MASLHEILDNAHEGEPAGCAALYQHRAVASHGTRQRFGGRRRILKSE
jgi:hypothetical protein